MADIMKAIKEKLKGSTTMPAGTGRKPQHSSYRDHEVHHHHGAGCCGHNHEHKILHESQHDYDELDEDGDNTTPGRGDCC